VEVPQVHDTTTEDGVHIADHVLGDGPIDAFEDTGEHELKDVPDRWRLHRAVES
jgi:hypothetical protein